MSEVQIAVSITSLTEKGYDVALFVNFEWNDKLLQLKVKTRL